MNRKNIELDLMKRYTTLFALRHLIDGGIDPRISKFCEGFTNLSDDFARIAVQTNAENIVKLSLRQRISILKLARERSVDLYGPLFRSELMISYSDMGYNAALIHKKIFIYELATYFYKNEHGTFTKNHLRNDNKLYVFIIVKWFEETNRTRLI
uniref:Uncharacterized protein n=1 Tax=Rhizophagus irregularis (strain DAOM 181602 / DAOM 197198 / MUCL 43194) TaxID=747089 RepID=U9TXB2_RHIID